MTSCEWLVEQLILCTQNIPCFSGYSIRSWDWPIDNFIFLPPESSSCWSTCSQCSVISRKSTPPSSPTSSSSRGALYARTTQSQHRLEIHWACSVGCCYPAVAGMTLGHPYRRHYLITSHNVIRIKIFCFHSSCVSSCQTLSIFFSQ